jgi:hypothetical protein
MVVNGCYVPPCLYAYANGSPVSRRDPTGLWSMIIEGYDGLGGAIEVGRDNISGEWFYGGRLGLGVGGGVDLSVSIGLEVVGYFPR